MSAKQKTILILFSLILIGLIVFLWWFFFLQKKPAVSTTTPTPSNEFLPFGRGGGSGVAPTNPTGPGATTSAQIQNGQTAPITQLRLISSVPIAGATTIADPKTGQTLIRYVERATGHIFETTTISGTAQRLTNTTIPKVEEALFVEDGSAIILRYLKDDGDTVESFYGKITQKSIVGQGTSTEAELLGAFLPENITGLAVSPDTKKIFYLVRDGQGSLGNIANPDGTKKTLLLTSPVAEWLPLWPEQKTIVLTTKPASDVGGYAYFLNSSSGILDLILQKILALTTLVNPSTHTVLFSQNDAGKNLSLNLLMSDKKTTIGLSVATFPEKCVWSTISPDVAYCAAPKAGVQGDYPDLWYQGVASFTDALWKINTKTGETTQLSTFDETKNVGIDVIQPFLDKKEQFIFFTNKKDSTLWSMRLAE